MKAIRCEIALVVFAAASIFLSASVSFPAESPEGGGAPPPARSIPGINAKDPFPQGCVDCHLNYVDMKMDTRFVTLLGRWAVEVEAELLAKAQSSAPDGVTLTGKHPPATDALKDVPAGCLTCHGKNSKKAPPFSRLIHSVHLVGGEQNNFMTLFQGECTFCHKMDTTTGAWSVRSAPEK